MDALSSCELRLPGTGSNWDMSVKISDSLLRRQRAASRDFSLRFSEFLPRCEEHCGGKEGDEEEDDELIKVDGDDSVDHRFIKSLFKWKSAAPNMAIVSCARVTR